MRERGVLFSSDRAYSRFNINHKDGMCLIFCRPVVCGKRLSPQVFCSSISPSKDGVTGDRRRATGPLMRFRKRSRGLYKRK
jgi:hypothetical protein